MLQVYNASQQTNRNEKENKETHTHIDKEAHRNRRTSKKMQIGKQTNKQSGIHSISYVYFVCIIVCLSVMTFASHAFQCKIRLEDAEHQPLCHCHCCCQLQPLSLWFLYDRPDNSKQGFQFATHRLKNGLRRC